MQLPKSCGVLPSLLSTAEQVILQAASTPSNFEGCVVTRLTAAESSRLLKVPL